MWQFFSYIWWFPYFFLTFDGFIFTMCSSNITCDSSLVTFGGSLTSSFFTFNGFILTLCNSNITCNSYFLTFSGSFIFFSHLTVSSSHCTVPTSYLTVLFSHMVVPLWHVTVLSYPSQKKGVRYPLVGNLLYQVTFFSHLAVP